MLKKHVEVCPTCGRPTFVSGLLRNFIVVSPQLVYVIALTIVHLSGRMFNSWMVFSGLVLVGFAMYGLDRALPKGEPSH